ncbi:DUF4418 family protein [Myxococcota bacterium]|nr:DUF4418 family protein [Myxococcota bacterium]
MQIVALVGLLLSLAGAAVPRFLFPVCGHVDGAPAAALMMRCAQSGRVVELAMLAATITWALVLVRSGKPGPRPRGLLMLLVLALALASASAVTVWPGLCGMPTMACVVGTRPAVLVLVVLELVVLGAGLGALRRERGT